MQYPSIDEFVSAVKYASDNFATLNSLELLLKPDGSPIMSVGNFAVVFKMKDRNSGKFYAVKCFFKEQEGREEAYRKIADELEYVSSNFITSVKYLDKELFVDSNATNEKVFPILIMDWIEGETLDKYIQKQINNPYKLSNLAYQFSRLVMWLLPQPFAHGDLNPDNILVRKDGSIVLVDYDGMYVPAMKGEKSRELGTPDFRHPDRTESDFDEHIDDYAAVSILLSLKAIATNSSILEKYGAADRLLISENDARNIENCTFFKEYFPCEDMELNRLAEIFMIVLSEKHLASLPPRLFSLQKPQRVIVEQKVDTIPISTEVTDEDLENAITIDGAKYSRDKKRLLKGDNISDFSILPGTKVICNAAFNGCESLQQITIPNSVTHIGNYAFWGCKNLQQITIPNSVTHIGDRAFTRCENLQQITIPNTVTHIGDSAFESCKNLQQITIPCGARAKFEKLLPSSYHQLLKEMD